MSRSGALAPNAPAAADSTAELSTTLHAEATQLLYRLSLVGYLATLLSAFALGLALWSDLSHPALFGWLAFISVVTIARYALYKIYVSKLPRIRTSAFWELLFVIGSGIMGLAWWFMGTVLLPAHDAFHQMIILMLVSLLSTGAVAECAPSRAAFVAYVFPALFPLGIHLIVMGTREEIVLGTIILILGVIITFIHDRASQAIRDTLLARRAVEGLEVTLGHAEHAMRTTQAALDREMSNRQRAEEAEWHSAQRLRLHVEQTNFGVVEWDQDFRITAWNTAAEKIFDQPRRAALGQSIVELIVAEEERDNARRAWSPAAVGKHPVVHRMEHLRGDGMRITCEWSHTPLAGSDGKLIGIASLVQDITERSNQEKLIQYMAHHDALTDLPNRRLLIDRLEQAIARARRSGRTVALLYVDLDRFKLINDTLGHAAGDSVLRTVARRILASVRAGDTVSREGGDEFVIALPDLEREEEAGRVVASLRSELGRPHEYDGHEFQVTCSVGMSTFPKDADSVEMLLKHADAAMYEAKESGRNTLCAYTDGLDSELARRFSLETRLRKAFEQEEFSLVYQPQVDAGTGRTIVIEALLRWTGGLDEDTPSPSEFIPVAEEIGLMSELGGWVLRDACREAARWPDLPSAPAPRIAVNLSPKQFLSVTLVDDVRRIIAETGIAASRLELEITESILVRNPEHASATMSALREMGVTLAVDNFGSGHFALAQIKRFPVDTLKVSPVFVNGVPNERNDVAIVLAMLAMARALGLRVVAEGVERAEQRDFLRSRGCDALQGFLCSPPVAAHDLGPFLNG